MAQSGLIEFLAAYGPTSDGNNMYDEFVVAAAEKAGVEPLAIPEMHSDDIVETLRGPTPRSVILTGTAGDGKTYTARKVLEKLSGSSRVWGNTEDTVTWPDPETGRSIVFVKDLSEIETADKAALIPKLIAAFSNLASPEIFVLCVNDGHLLRTWETHMGAGPDGPAILTALRELLRDDKDTPEHWHFRLINMSRRSHAETIDAIIDQICKHPGWQDYRQCVADPQACPILINREILLKNEPASLRSRLRALVEIAAADDRHLSIRQIIILVVNALLGDTTSPYQTPLMNASRAAQRAASGQYDRTNPYNNVFGENHPAARRMQHAGFAALDEFGIGFETNNFFDDLLLDVDHRPDPVDHPQYGSASYAQLRENYKENPSERISELREALTAQRRRLFFEWPDAPLDKRETSPWQLTVHSYGDLYINLLRAEDERDQELFLWTRPRIVKGLNRALTGSLTETADSLWLTQPSGVYKGADIPILVTNPITWRSRPYSLALAAPSYPGRPPRLELDAAYPQKHTLASLPLTPTLFEYLMRVHDGALPMSFSNQCFQDVRSFQIRSVGAIQNSEGDEMPDLKAVDTSEETLRERVIGSLEGQL
ncbi:hypothetical protein [Nitratireductor sp. ZSWI3]|uniref:hypothetical protein n=1 Tax=Nitratireductor sp. ZSWI3 TaxID=2966359 RepID=UPI00214F7549|nr:hypothetical protein [Nitratireductor sp. ZSWI3]MCR4266770.1 hypothetical protein [Nitratireductor sp. ZSWI3]